MKSRTIPLILIPMVLMLACKKEPDLTLVEETLYEGTAITAIATDADWEVEVVSSDLTRVVLGYSKCLEKGVSAVLDNGKLSLQLSQSTSFPVGATIKAVVYTNTIGSVALDYSKAVFTGDFSSTSLTMTLKNNSSCAALSANVAGDCQITLDKTSVLSDCNIACANANIVAGNTSRLAGTIAPSDTLVVELQNNSRFVNYYAEPQAVRAKISSSSLMNIAQTSTQSMEIELVDSEASVNVSGTITGSLSDGSTLYYKGTPDTSGLDVSDDSSLVHF